jgi:predicted oxidoreductase
MPEPTIRDYVENALDFAHENHWPDGFTQSDIDFVIADTRKRVAEDAMPRLPKATWMFGESP